MKKLALVTGGCGFIGVNAAARLMSRGWRVSVLDDLSRKGVETNLAWLKRQGPVDFVRADLRDAGAVDRWVKTRSSAEFCLHLAAQVAVTSSTTDPRTDFEINALGSLNLLEALRKLKRPPFTIYTSTNKVYGGMEGVRTVLAGSRYRYAARPQGISEAELLDFHSPYGCSKGAADQYFRDYHRIYGLPTVVFRQSCIYGYHQQGNEDQGWLAHFMKQALAGKGVTLYGDGKQVRDALFIDDLIDLFELAYRKKDRAAGRVYNVGGGPKRTLSLLELLDWIADKQGRKIPVERRGWRPGDQRVYVSDVRLIGRELGWRPTTSVGRGLEQLWGFLQKPA